MKEVKTAAVQRTTKRLKQAKAEAKEATDLADLETELASFKSLDHVKMAEFVFYSFILKDEYIKEKLGSIGLTEACEEKKQSTFMELSPKIISSKSFQDSIKAERQDLTVFFKKLFHEPLPREHQAQSTKKRPQDSTNPKAESFFVSSLNASDSEGEVSDADSFVGVRSSALVFTDNEEEESEVFSGAESDSEKKKKKRNRLGQLARRRLAEKLHGRNAKHLQAGGLSVKEREEKRKERSVQKRAREARIKKQKLEREEAKKQQQQQPQSTQSKSKLDPSLHPSWAAKLQNQNKINATTFQGQKIKFDDDSSSSTFSQKSKEKKNPEKPIECKKNAEKLVESKPKVFKQKVSEAPKIDPKLHPSWAAKLQQQHKTNATAFQGQKIKFDDDE